MAKANKKTKNNKPSKLASKFKVNRNKAREQLKQSAAANAGGSFYVNLPDGVELFKPKKGKNKIAVLPFIASRDLPLDAIEKGDVAQRMRIAVHFNIGPEDKRVICPAVFGKKCPICDHRAALFAQGRDRDDPEVAALKSQKRDLYNIIDYNEEEKGLKIWDVSLQNFSKLLDTEAAEVGEDYSFGHHDPIDGADLALRMSEESFKGNKYYETQRIDFLERTEPIDDEILETVLSLDKEIHVYSYKELEKMLFEIEVEGDEDDEDEKPAKSKKAAKGKAKPVDDDDEDDDEDEDDDDDEDEDEDDEDDDDEDEDDEDEETDEDEDDEETDEDEDDEDEDDEDEDEDDDEPAPKKGRAKSAKASKPTKPSKSSKTAKSAKASKSNKKSSKKYDDDEEDD